MNWLVELFLDVLISLWPTHQWEEHDRSIAGESKMDREARMDVSQSY